MALRAARAHTGKARLGIFDGAYHGTHDWGQVQASPASPDADHPEPAFTSDGVPDCVLDGVQVLPYNSEAAFDAIRAGCGELAMVMVQAVQASNPRLGMGPWLRKLEAVCRECEVLLAFDETVTGFRMAWGGGHVYYGVAPDLVTYGKVIGGGMPIGCVGGRAAVMRRFGTAVNGLFPLVSADPGDPPRAEPVAGDGQPEVHGVFGAIGTFNGFPLALASGVATLRELERRKDVCYPWLEATNRRVATDMNVFCEAGDYEAQVVFGGGAYLQLLFQRGEISCAADVANGPREAKLTTELKLHLLDQGINVIKTFLLTLEHTDADIDALVAAMQVALERMREDGLI
jgi:glutamate-1-semialdehyde aminotransferase